MNVDDKVSEMKNNIADLNEKIYDLIHSHEAECSSVISLLHVLDFELERNEEIFSSSKDSQDKKEARESYRNIVAQFAKPVLLSLQKIIGEEL